MTSVATGAFAAAAVLLAVRSTSVASPRASEAVCITVSNGRVADGADDAVAVTMSVAKDIACDRLLALIEDRFHAARGDALRLTCVIGEDTVSISDSDSVSDALQRIPPISKFTVVWKKDSFLKTSCFESSSPQNLFESRRLSLDRRRIALEERKVAIEERKVALDELRFQHNGHLRVTDIPQEVDDITKTATIPRDPELNGDRKSEPGNVQASSIDVPLVFISYCWKNSKSAMLAENNTGASAAGPLDPRTVKQLIVNNFGAKVKVWLDVDELKEGESLFDGLADNLGRVGKYNSTSMELWKRSKIGFSLSDVLYHDARNEASLDNTTAKIIVNVSERISKFSTSKTVHNDNPVAGQKGQLFKNISAESISASDFAALFSSLDSMNEIDSTGKTPLMVVSSVGLPDYVKILLDAKVNVGIRDSDGNTALHLAIAALVDPVKIDIEKFEVICELLVDAGADLNVANNEGNTPLQLAILVNSYYITELLVYNGASLASPILHLACKEEISPKILAFLLTLDHDWQYEKMSDDASNDADGSVAEFTNSSVLKTAVYNENLAAAALLLSLVEVNPNGALLDNWRPLSVAICNDDLPMYRLLKKYGADIDVSTFHLAAQAGSLRILRHTVEVEKFAINDLDEKGFTGVMWALLYAENDVAHYLIENGATLVCSAESEKLMDKQVKSIYSPIFCAIQSGNLETLKLVATRVPRAELERSLKNQSIASDYSCSVDATCLKDNLPALKYLVEELNLPIPPTVLFSAMTASLEVIDFLVSHGASMDVISENGHCFVQQYIKAGRLDVIQKYFDSGILNPRLLSKADSSGVTPLHSAAESSNPLGIVKYLLSAVPPGSSSSSESPVRASIDAQGPAGRTALHIATLCHAPDVVQALIAAGANLNIPDNWGATPLDYASTPRSWYTAEDSVAQKMVAGILATAGAQHGSQQYRPTSFDSHNPLPSGTWAGFWKQGGNKQPTELNLEFVKGEVLGFGGDLVGPFTVKGTYKKTKENFSISFTKSYTSHNIIYEGLCSDRKILGQFFLSTEKLSSSSDGSFELVFPET
ncbi:Ankyrin repeat domain-containing protein 55 [Entophlyctis sp. JEL0112]|nr:Ankyrin repeat domain-containing protein 55 [Entophlyctis sp. JEL0112]